MTLDSSQKVAFLSIAPITYLLPVPKGRSDGASLVIDGRGRPEMLEGTPRKRVSGGSPATPAPAGSCRKPDLTSSTQAHSRVTLDAPDTCSRLSAQRLSDFAQNRHPERSALQIYRKETPLCAESKDPGGAYLTDAVRVFSTTEVRRICGRRGLELCWKWKTDHHFSEVLVLQIACAT
jgi:hypothetical protein